MMLHTKKSLSSMTVEELESIIEGGNIEIGQLQEDLLNCKNDISKDAIKYLIQTNEIKINRTEKIVKEKKEK